MGGLGSRRQTKVKRNSGFNHLISPGTLQPAMRQTRRIANHERSAAFGPIPGGIKTGRTVRGFGPIFVVFSSISRDNPSARARVFGRPKRQVVKK